MKNLGFTVHRVPDQVVDGSSGSFKAWCFRTMALTSIMVLSVAVFGVSASNAASSKQDPADTITICHATNSDSNPYNVQNPAKSGDVSGHSSDTGPIWDSTLKSQKIQWGDIIPPFDYTGGSYPGLNWTTAGQAIWNNGCNIPVAPTTGSITLVKVLAGDTAPDAASAWTLSATNGTTSISGATGVTNASATTGLYTLSESGPTTNYTASNWVCLNGNTAVSVANSQFTLAAGANVTCTITNTYTKPVVGGTSTLTLVKVLAGDPAPDQTSAWTLSATGTNSISGITGSADVNSKVVASGTYTLSESGPTNNYSSSWSCKDSADNTVAVSNNQVTLAANAVVTCTATNTYTKPNPAGTVTVTIAKYIDDAMANSDSAGNTTFSMTATWNAANIGSGTANYDLGPTGYNNQNAYEATTSYMTSGADYSTYENLGTTCTSDTGYKLEGYSVGDSLEAAANATVSTDIPSLTNITSNKFIIVWNESCQPKITVHKVTNIETESTFPFSITGQNIDTKDFNLASGASQTFNVPSGTYNVTEGADANNWTLTDSSCVYDNQSVGNVIQRGHEVILNSGDSVTCTFTNTFDNGGNPTYSISGKVYRDANQNHQYDEGEQGLSGWTVYIDSPEGESNEGNHQLDSEEVHTESDASGDYTISGLAAGCYNVREVNKSGWNETQPQSADQFEYKVAVGGALCPVNVSFLDSVKGLFVHTAEAAALVVNPNPTGVNFGNYKRGGSSGGSSGGSTPPGQVLGDTTSIPYIAPTDQPQGQVLGATTTNGSLPVTGNSLNFLWALLALTGIIILPAKIAMKMKEDLL